MLNFLSGILGNRKHSKKSSGQRTKSLKSLMGKPFRFEPLEQRQLLSLTIPYFNTPAEIPDGHKIQWNIQVSDDPNDPNDDLQQTDLVDIYWDANGDGSLDIPGDVLCYIPEETVDTVAKSIKGTINPNQYGSTVGDDGPQQFLAFIKRGENYIANAAPKEITLTGTPDLFQLNKIENSATEEAEENVVISLQIDDGSFVDVYPNLPSGQKNYWFDYQPEKKYRVAANGVYNGNPETETLYINGPTPSFQSMFLRVDFNPFDAQSRSLGLSYRPTESDDFDPFFTIFDPDMNLEPYFVTDGWQDGNGCCGGSPLDGAGGGETGVVPGNLGVLPGIAGIDSGIPGLGSGDSGLGSGSTSLILGGSGATNYILGMGYSPRAKADPVVAALWAPHESDSLEGRLAPEIIENYFGIDGEIQNLKSSTFEIDPNTYPDCEIDAAILPGTVSTAGLAAGHYTYGVMANATSHDLLEDRYHTYQACGRWGAIDVLPSSNEYGFGTGWSFQDLDRLVLLGDEYHQDILLATGDQNTIWFDDDGSQTYISPLGTLRHLEKLENGTYKLSRNPDGYVRYFDSTGQLDRLEDSFGKTIKQYEYYDGYLTAVTDELGKETIFEYESFSGGAAPKTLLDKIETPDGLAYSFDYEYQSSTSSFLLTSAWVYSQEDSNPQDPPTWEFSYTTSSLMESSTNPLDETVHYNYNDFKQLVSETFSNGATPSFSANLTPYVDNTGLYHDADYPCELPMPWSGTLVDQLGQSATYTWSVNYDVLTETIQGASGKVVTNILNEYGQISSTSVDPDGNGPMTAQTAEFTYDAAGNKYSILMPDGQYQYWTYDSNHPDRLLSYSDQLDRVTTYNYTAETSYTVKTTEEAYILTGTEYLSNTASTAYTDTSGTYNYSFLPVGTLLKRIDPNGNLTLYIYDDTLVGGLPAASYGNLIEIVHAAGTAEQSSMRYEYDERGNRIAVIDELNRRTDYIYDTFNRLEKIVGPYLLDGSDNPVLHDAIVDNPTSGTNWDSFTAGGYDHNYLVAEPANPADATVEWTFNNLISGKQYEILVTWVADSGNTTSRPLFSVGRFAGDGNFAGYQSEVIALPFRLGIAVAEAWHL